MKEKQTVSSAHRRILIVKIYFPVKWQQRAGQRGVGPVRPGLLPDDSPPHPDPQGPDVTGVVAEVPSRRATLRQLRAGPGHPAVGRQPGSRQLPAPADRVAAALLQEAAVARLLQALGPAGQHQAQARVSQHSSHLGLRKRVRV